MLRRTVSILSLGALLLGLPMAAPVQAAIPSASSAQGIDLSQVNDNTPVTVGLFSKVAEQALPSVVSIRIHLKLTDEEKKQQEKFKSFLENPSEHMDDPDFKKFMQRYFSGMYEDFQDFFSNPENMTVSSGAGVVFDSMGHIVTNNHVVARQDGEGDLEVRLYDGRVFRGDQVKVVAEAPLVDLAVLKINANDLHPAVFGDSDKVKIGEPVLAIGHPLELENSVSEGIISAKGRRIDKAVIEDHFQTTAMINPGNSGGALVDMHARVIGINIAIATTTRRWQGIGFSVPSNTVRKVVENIIRSGKEGFGYLGVQMMADSLVGERARLLNWYGLKKGVLVEGVVKGAAAEKGGVRADDVITEINGHELEDNQDLIRSVASLPVGEQVKIKLLRPNEKQDLMPLEMKLTLGERPSQEQLDKELGQKNVTKAQAPASRPTPPLGVEVEPTSGGLTIRAVASGSIASRAVPAPLQVGDTLLRVNLLPVRTANDLAAAIKPERIGKRADHLVHFMRNGKLMRTLVPVK